MHRPAFRAQRSRARRGGDRRAGAGPLTHSSSARPRILIAGISARAAADSAARAGFAVTAIDAFADCDQHPAVAAHAVPSRPGRAFTAAALTAAACRAAGDAVVYLSPLDNHPSEVERLARGRQLWGNSPAVLRRVRDPHQLASALRQAGLPAPQLAEHADPPPVEHGWLQKPRASGGGRGVRPWTPGRALHPAWYLQERIAGPSCSVVFVAAAGRAAALGVSYQLVGDPRFGATGYQYCGSVIPADDDAVLGRGGAAIAPAVQLACSVTAAFGLVGLNGVDFIVGWTDPSQSR